jgi:hypothetical protein
MMKFIALRFRAASSSDWDDGARKSSGCEPYDLFSELSVEAVGAKGDHVGLKVGALENEFVVEHCLHDSRKYTFRDLSALLDRVVSVLEDLGIDD